MTDGGVDASKRPPLNVENPYCGLDAFDEGDKDFFFGRADEVDTLLQLVERRTLTVLYGASGLGKTSLLQAGVFPALRYMRFVVLSLRLAARDLVSAPAYTLRAAHRAAAEKGVSCAAPKDDESLWEYFQRVAFWNERNLRVVPVLVFDQFEEVLRAHNNTQFIEQLADLVENHVPVTVTERHDDAERYRQFAPPEVRVVLSLREEYLPDVEELAGAMPSIMVNRLRLQRMNGEQALKAVQLPAGKDRNGNFRLADHLAEQIVRRLGRTGQRDRSGPPKLKDLLVEPSFLSLMCSELNRKRARAGLETFDETLLGEEEVEVLQSFYLRETSDLGAQVREFIEDGLVEEGHRVLVQRRKTGLSDEVLQTLQDRRLIRIEDRLGTPYVELIHDVLLKVVERARIERLAAEQARLATEEKARRQREEAEREAEEQRLSVEQARRKAEAMALALQEKAEHEAATQREQRRKLQRTTRNVVAVTILIVLTAVTTSWWRERTLAPLESSLATVSVEDKKAAQFYTTKIAAYDEQRADEAFALFLERRRLELKKELTDTLSWREEKRAEEILKALKADGVKKAEAEAWFGAFVIRRKKEIERQTGTLWKRFADLVDKEPEQAILTGILAMSSVGASVPRPEWKALFDKLGAARLQATVRRAHAGPVSACAFVGSTAGLAMSAGEDGTLRFWKIEDSKITSIDVSQQSSARRNALEPLSVQSARGTNEPTAVVAFASTKERGKEGGVLVWRLAPDPASSDAQKWFPSRDSISDASLFGTRLVAAGEMAELRDLRKQGLRSIMFEEAPWRVRFSSDPARALVIGRRQAVLVDWPRGIAVAPPIVTLHPGEPQFTAGAFVTESEVALGRQDGRVGIWRTTELEEGRYLPAPDPPLVSERSVRMVDYCAGTIVASVRGKKEGGALWLWTRKGREWNATALGFPRVALRYSNVSEDCSAVIACGDDGALRVWKLGEPASLELPISAASVSEWGERLGLSATEQPGITENAPRK